VATAPEADVAVLRIKAPYEPRGEAGSIESFFRAGSLAFPAAEAERIAAICQAVPQGQLPFDIPSSIAAIEASRPDVPFDTASPTFRFGHGLRYTG
jgi:beta-glucosidase